MMYKKLSRMALSSILVDGKFYFEDINVILSSKNAKPVAYVVILTPAHYFWVTMLTF